MRRHHIRALIRAATMSIVIVCLASSAFGISGAAAERAVPAVAAPTWIADYVRLDPFSTATPASTVPVAIDTKGEVLLNAETQKGYLPPELWSDGRLITMSQYTHNPGSGTAQEMSPNGNYIVAGNSLLERGGASTAIKGLDDISGVNDEGDVSGTVAYYGIQYPAIWKAGAVTQLSPAHGDTTGINDSGQVVGGAYLGAGEPQHAFVWQAGKTIDIGHRFGDSCASTATAINNNGQVAAEYSCDGEYNTAFIWSPNKLVKLGTPVSCLYQPEDWSMNSEGDVLGGDCDSWGINFQWLVAWFHTNTSTDVRIDQLSPATPDLDWFGGAVPTFINDNQQIAAAERETGPHQTGWDTTVIISPPKLGSQYLELKWASVVAGGADVMAGTGFRPSSKITLVVTCETPKCSSTRGLGTISVDAEGSFWATRLSIPKSLLPGDYLLQARSGATTLAQSPLRIAPAR